MSVNTEYKAQKKRWESYINSLTNKFAKSYEVTGSNNEEILKQIMDDTNFDKKAMGYTKNVSNAVKKKSKKEHQELINQADYQVAKKLTKEWQSKNAIKTLNNKMLPLKNNKEALIQSESLRDIDEIRSNLSKYERIANQTGDKELKRSVQKFQRQIDNMTESSIVKKNARINKNLTREYDKVIDKKAKEQIGKTLNNRTSTIAITEARKEFQTDKIERAKDRGVQYIKWTLSGSHRIYDICDDLANADSGNGKGIYPINSIPYGGVAHPHCKCKMVNAEV